MPQKLDWKFLNPPQERNLEYPDIRKTEQKLIDPYNKLPIHLPRIQTTRFPRLHQDEQIVANIGLIWKDLLKSCLEGFYEYSLDNIEFDNQIRSMTKDGYGGIDYYNYQFSDSYDDEDKRTDRPLGPGMENYAKLSVHDALEKYGIMNLGDLIITPDMISFVKEMMEIGRVPEQNIEHNQAKYELMFTAAQAIVQACPAMAGHPIMCLAGAFATEMGWRFDDVIINEEERVGQNKDYASKRGLADCGEGWVGYTNWDTKIEYIVKLNLPCPRNPDAYIAAGAGVNNRDKIADKHRSDNNNILATLTFEDSGRLFQYYAQKHKSSNYWLVNWPKHMNEPNAANEAMGASYMFKHGEGHAKEQPTWWLKSVAEGRKVKYTQGKIIKRSGFACHLYNSMMFAYWCSHNKQLPPPGKHPWEG